MNRKLYDALKDASEFSTLIVFGVVIYFRVRRSLVHILARLHLLDRRALKLRPPAHYLGDRRLTPDTFHLKPLHLLLPVVLAECLTFFIAVRDPAQALYTIAIGNFIIVGAAILPSVQVKRRVWE
jgi:hypothetical protein